MIRNSDQYDVDVDCRVAHKIHFDAMLFVCSLAYIVQYNEHIRTSRARFIFALNERDSFCAYFFFILLLIVLLSFHIVHAIAVALMRMVRCAS